MTESHPPYRWIVSRRYDLTFFIGAVVMTFLFLGVYAGLSAIGLAPSGPAALFTYFIFTTFLDLPHIFQTFSRTHQDPVEFQRRKALYTWGIPVIMACGLVIPLLGLDNWFVAFMALYGSHHIVRQHVGFMKIYQGLNETPSRFDSALSRAAIELGLYACILYDYAAEAKNQWTWDVTVYGNIHAVFPAVPAIAVDAFGRVAMLVVAAFVLRQLYLAMSGRRVNLPKVLLMGAALLSHFTVFVVAVVPFLVAEAIETAYHDVQYHAWVANYQRKRFPHVKRVWLKWLGAALLYGAIAGGIETIGYTNELFYWLFAPFGMLTLFHYYIDGKIWKLRNNPELREAIFARPEAPAEAAKAA